MPPRASRPPPERSWSPRGRRRAGRSGWTRRRRRAETASRIPRGIAPRRWLGGSGGALSSSFAATPHRRCATWPRCSYWLWGDGARYRCRSSA